ncbi:hypothetical protein Tco_0921484 [Tanacetum coccineum]
MANLSSCDLDVLSEVPYFDSSPNDMINQDVYEMHYFEQTHIYDFQDNKIHSDSNIIPYSQYLQESQDAVIHDTNSSAPNDLLVLYLVEQMTDHVAHLDKENQTNKMVNESLTVELKRYKEQHAVISVINDEETLILEEECRSKMLDKQNDPISIEKKINISPIDSKLNKIKEDFAPSELPKVSLLNESLKKLKYQLANFDKVVKKRTTSDAITAGAWGFEHTKAYFCSIDKNDLEIKIKQLSIDNDQLLNQIMSQDILHIAMNSIDILDVNKSCVNECFKCLELETEHLKKKDFVEKDVFDKLVKSYSTLEKHCISLELATQLNQEIFQKENSGANQNAPTFNQLFKIDELKA